jgi:methyl-accepting chemotaxis protein
MKKLKIAHQLFALVGLLMAAFAVATYLQIRTASQAIYDDRFNLLRTQVESAISILDAYNQREKAGEMTHEAAQAEAFKILSKVKFEPSGYVFGYDYNVVQRFHPSPVNIGKDMSGQVDQAGTYFSKDMVEKGRAGGGRTITTGASPASRKISSFHKGVYSAAFEPWQLVVVTGVYSMTSRPDQYDDLEGAYRLRYHRACCRYRGSRGLFHPQHHQASAGRSSRVQAVADENVTIAIPHTDMNNEIGMMAKATKSLQEKVRERHAMSEREAAQQMALDGERESNQRMQRDEATAQTRVVSTIGQALEADRPRRPDGPLRRYRPEIRGPARQLQRCARRISRPPCRRSAPRAMATSASARKRSAAPPTNCRSAPSARPQPGGNLGSPRRTQRRRPPDRRRRP